ncbi:MAG: DUF2975 domain-containing protein [Eggerthellaceae bacterium]|jgi:hypothetical protein|nr:DUF2975 domain-containing protein [Eggerthellaceae bacterium]MDR2715870.1 DUF2975 domain-containing protein [Coriobacteriaceae bacterium]
MKQKEMSYVLKAIDGTVIVACLVLMFFILPRLAGDSLGGPQVFAAYWPFLAFSWIGLAPLVFLAVIAWGIFSDIGRDNSFSERNAARLRAMSYLSAATILVWLGGLAYFAFSGLSVLGIMLAFAVAMAIMVVMAVVCACLSHLTAKAAQIKHENDLTV